MSMFMTRALKLDRPIFELVKELKRDLPTDATGITLLIFAVHFAKAEAGKVGDVPICFVLPTADDVVGTACLGFGRGNLETSPGGSR